MKLIYVDYPEMIKLEAIGAETKGKEFSGVGFVEVDKENEWFRVYDIELLSLGTSAFTEIETEKIIKLQERTDHVNMRVWFHRHPLGNGVPGPHNWSGTDNMTIEKMPLGGIPELVKWSLSIVRTPIGWVGRFDNHIAGKTVHLPVFPQAEQTIYGTIGNLRQAEWKKADEERARNKHTKKDWRKENERGRWWDNLRDKYLPKKANSSSASTAYYEDYLYEDASEVPWHDDDPWGEPFDTDMDCPHCQTNYRVEETGLDTYYCHRCNQGFEVIDYLVCPECGGQDLASEGRIVECQNVNCGAIFYEEDGMEVGVVWL